METKRNRSSGFVEAKDAHKTWKLAQKRAQLAEKLIKEKSISRKRKQRGRGYATPGHFNASFECDVVYKYDTQKHSDSVPITHHGEAVLTSNHAPLYHTATSRGISFARDEDGYNIDLAMRDEEAVMYRSGVCYGMHRSDAISKEMHERWSAGWE